LLPYRLKLRRFREIRSTKVAHSPFLQRMQTLLRTFALVALALSLPACASTPKKSSCCSSSAKSGKCAAGDASCHAPTAKKKAS
jgi:hypothetical protein